MSEINQRIKNLRLNSRMSQQEIANKLVVSTQLISKWECSDITPATEDIIKMSKLYGVSLDYILTGVANIDDENILNRNLKNQEIKEILKKEYKNILKNIYDKEIELLINYTNLPEEVSVNDDIKKLICFDIENIIELNNFEIYKTIKESYKLKGTLKFELLHNPKETQIDFFKEAIKEDAENIQKAFESYISYEKTWDDKVLLLLINNGAMVTKIYGLITYIEHSMDACPNNIYEPEYVFDLVATRLLKAELEKSIN